jgi:hypothetical protein
LTKIPAKPGAKGATIIPYFRKFVNSKIAQILKNFIFVQNAQKGFTQVKP